MKPYTKTITGEESMKVYQALSRGLFAMERAVAKGDVGSAVYVQQIKEALEIMNRPCEGGFESAQERREYGLKRIIADCDQFGAD